MEIEYRVAFYSCCAARRKHEPDRSQTESTNTYTEELRKKYLDQQFNEAISYLSQVLIYMRKEHLTLEDFEWDIIPDIEVRFFLKEKVTT